MLVSIIEALSENRHPVSTQQKQAYRARVNDWLDGDTVGEFAVAGSLTDRIIRAHKMCEHKPEGK
jgi:hypothetical protein